MFGRKDEKTDLTDHRTGRVMQPARLTLQTEANLPISSYDRLHDAILSTRNDLRKLNARIDLLVEALGYEFFETEPVPAVETKLQIRAKTDSSPRAGSRSTRNGR